MAAEEAATLLTLALAVKHRKGSLCTVGIYLRSHPRAAELEALLEAASSERVTYSAAADACEAADIPLTGNTLSRHCRGKCKCGK